MRKKKLIFQKIPQEEQLIIKNKNLILKRLMFKTSIIVIFLIMGIVKEIIIQKI